MSFLKNRLALLRSLIQGEVAHTGPAYVAVDVTRRCNIHCLGCFFHCTQGTQAHARESSGEGHAL